MRPYLRCGGWGGDFESNLKHIPSTIVHLFAGNPRQANEDHPTLSSFWSSSYCFFLHEHTFWHVLCPVLHWDNQTPQVLRSTFWIFGSSSVSTIDRHSEHCCSPSYFQPYRELHLILLRLIKQMKSVSLLFQNRTNGNGILYATLNLDHPPTGLNMFNYRGVHTYTKDSGKMYVCALKT